MRYNTRKEVENIGYAGVAVEEDNDGTRARQLSSWWLYVDNDDIGYAPHAKKDGFWEAWITKWISQQLDRHDVFIDIGANHGYYTMLAADAGKVVFAFEPQRHLADLIKKSIDYNEFHDALVIPLALSVGPQRTEKMKVPVGHGMNAALSNEGDIEVAVASLDLFSGVIDDGEKVLIKIDAEGGEINIMAGAVEFINRNDVTILLEYRRERYGTDKADAFSDWLLENFDLFLVDYNGEAVTEVNKKMLMTPRQEDLMIELVKKVVPLSEFPDAAV